MAQEKAANALWRRAAQRKERITEFLFEIVMQIEIRSARIDKREPSIVIDEEGDMYALTGDLDPILVLALLLQLPH